MKNKFNIFSKTIFVIVSILLVVLVMSSCSKSGIVTNDEAEKDEKGRYLTINNLTGQVINELHVTVDDGTEIESLKKSNLDETSFSLIIPEQYKEHTDFTVTLIDRYELKYQKRVSNVPLTGRTEINITEEDYIKEDGDWWDKVNQFFNGD